MKKLLFAAPLLATALIGTAHAESKTDAKSKKHFAKLEAAIADVECVESVEPLVIYKIPRVNRWPSHREERQDRSDKGQRVVLVHKNYDPQACADSVAAKLADVEIVAVSGDDKFGFFQVQLH